MCIVYTAVNVNIKMYKKWNIKVYILLLCYLYTSSHNIIFILIERCFLNIPTIYRIVALFVLFKNALFPRFLTLS